MSDLEHLTTEFVCLWWCNTVRHHCFFFISVKVKISEKMMEEERENRGKRKSSSSFTSVMEIKREREERGERGRGEGSHQETRCPRTDDGDAKDKVEESGVGLREEVSDRVHSLSFTLLLLHNNVYRYEIHWKLKWNWTELEKPHRSHHRKRLQHYFLCAQKQNEVLTTTDSDLTTGLVGDGNLSSCCWLFFISIFQTRVYREISSFTAQHTRDVHRQLPLPKSLIL